MSKNWYTIQKSSFNKKDFLTGLLSATVPAAGVALPAVIDHTNQSGSVLTAPSPNTEGTAATKNSAPENYSILPRKNNHNRTEEIDQLKFDEGSRSFVYPDPIKGWKVPTIGVGHAISEYEGRPDPRLLEVLNNNLTIYREVVSGRRGLTDQQINQLLSMDLHYTKMGVEDVCKYYSVDYNRLSPTWKVVLNKMGFQLGAGVNRGLTQHGLASFKEMFKALREGNYREALVQMIKSKWATQTPDRAARYLYQIAKEYNIPINFRNRFENYPISIHTHSFK